MFQSNGKLGYSGFFKNGVFEDEGKYDTLFSWIANSIEKKVSCITSMEKFITKASF